MALTDKEKSALRTALDRSRREANRRHGPNAWDVADAMAEVEKVFAQRDAIGQVPEIVVCSDARHGAEQAENARLVAEARRSLTRLQAEVIGLTSTQTLEAVSALRELVRLHRLKEDIDMRRTYGPMDEPGQPTFGAKTLDYDTNKPLAWQAAYGAIDRLDLP